MKAGEEHFSRFLEGHEKQFVIPVYQRNYDWKKEHCEVLFHDLVNIINTNADSYFIGSIVSVFDPSPSKSGEFLIIDGQQRITSLSLLLLAMVNLLHDNKISSDTPHLERQIRETYLVNQYQQDERRIRLKPIKNDNDAFTKLFSGEQDNLIESSNITANYRVFEKLLLNLTNQNLSVDDIFTAFKKLMIVDIRLTLGIDNPQAIFESLNSTGKDLDQSDLVRNFILMNKSNEEQVEIYNQYWLPIEANTDYNVTDFVRHFLSYENGKVPNQKKVYAEFKAFVQAHSDNPSQQLYELLKKLKKFSKYYQTFRRFNSESAALNETLKRIDRLRTTTAFPFLFDVFEAWKTELIEINDVEKIVDTVESFIFRRHMCKLPTNALNKIFVSLGGNIRKSMRESEETYREVFYYYISTGGRFPDDELFEENIAHRDIYNLRSNHRVHLFERLENFENKERVDVEAMISAKKDGLTLEHIMPRTLTPTWKEALGNDWKRIHAERLHQLGNISLTAYNSELGNKPFTEKRNKENGFKDSKLYLNAFVKEQSDWTEAEILARTNLLIEKAKRIWRKPKAKFKPKERQDLEFSIHEEKDFTGLKPEAFSILGEKKVVSSWRDVLTQSLTTLYDLEPGKLMALAQKPTASSYLKVDGKSLRSPWKISDDLYVERNLSTTGMINFLKTVLDDLEIEEEDFSVFLKSN